MTILDSFAVLAFLRDEPAAAEVERILDDGDAVMTASGLAEVTDRLVRVGGRGEEDVALELAELGLLGTCSASSGVALASGRLRARYYHRIRCAVSLADCIAAETARYADRPLATSDPHLLDVCAAEEVDVVVLPASDGSRWRPRR